MDLLSFFGLLSLFLSGLLDLDLDLDLDRDSFRFVRLDFHLNLNSVENDLGLCSFLKLYAFTFRFFVLICHCTGVLREFEDLEECWGLIPSFILIGLIPGPCGVLNLMASLLLPVFSFLCIFMFSSDDFLIT